MRRKRRVSSSVKVAETLQRAHDAIDSGRPKDAIRGLVPLVEREPIEPEVLEILAKAYVQCGEYLPALKIYDRLIGMRAATDETWLATGNALAAVGEYAQAIGAYEHGIRLNDTHAATYHNLARVVYRLGDVDRAAKHLRQAIECSDTIDSRLSLATVIPSVTDADHAEVRRVRTEFASRLRDEVTGSDVPSFGPKTRRDPRCLRIGYVSSYFHSANYMKPVWALLNHHDRAAFQIHLLSDSPSDQPLTGYESHGDDVVHDITDLSNLELAALIRELKIDILVDLNAYSTAERLGLFLSPIAPVTVAWFNMYATSGLPAIDYIVGDDEVVLPEEEPFYTERVLRLPLSYLTFQGDRSAPDVVPPPCSYSSQFTFGSLISQYKITGPVLDAWGRILNAADDSRLVLANTTFKSVENRVWVTKQFTDRGVDAEKLTFLPPAAHHEFLSYYNQIDVALDGFPYNGGTTTMEAIWQGVPVLTFDGDRWASRTSQTLLRRSAFHEFVASDCEAMIAYAIHLATDSSTPARLASLRSSARQSLSESPACNGRQLARSMEELYSTIWNDHLKGSK